MMFLWRPVLADPPLCTWIDLCTKLTIDDVADMHEALDLKEAYLAKTRMSTDGH
jgi:hypothetical protein